MSWAPLARILLRYVAGAGILGSAALGDKLAADPDLVLYLSLGIAAGVEAAYGYAKTKGWRT
jgi:preprotein translocase subunit Sec61beta